MSELNDHCADGTCHTSVAFIYFIGFDSHGGSGEHIQISTNCECNPKNFKENYGKYG